jgi:hypothetical protein
LDRDPVGLWKRETSLAPAGNRNWIPQSSSLNLVDHVKYFKKREKEKRKRGKKRGFKKNENRKITRVEAGSNNSTVTLRVVGGDDKESLKSETVKYGHESYGTRTRK